MIQELTPTSILSLFETTKSERQSFIVQIVEAINEGHTDPRKVHLQVRMTEELLDTLKEHQDYRKALLEACQKEGKSHEFHNSKFEVKEVGTRYDWSACNDDEMNELLAQEKELKEKIKARSEFLKNVPLKGTTIVNEETGEAKSIYPPTKTSTTAVAVKLL